MQMDQMARTQCEQYESEMLSARFLEFFTMVVIRCRYEHTIKENFFSSFENIPDNLGEGGIKCFLIKCKHDKHVNTKQHRACDWYQNITRLECDSERI